MDIFDFGRGGSVKEVDKQFSKDEDLAGALFFWQVGKRGAKFVGNAVPAMASNTKRTVSRLRSDISYKLHEDESYEMMQARVAKKNARLDKKDEFMNNVYRKIHMGRDREKRQLMVNDILKAWERLKKWIHAENNILLFKKANCSNDTLLRFCLHRNHPS